MHTITNGAQRRHRYSNNYTRKQNILGPNSYHGDHSIVSI